MKGQGGFSLLEGIMVIVVLGILSVIGFSFIASSARTYQLGAIQGRLTGEVWVAMNRIVKELSYSDFQNVSSPTTPATPTPPASTSTTGSILTFTTITANSPAGWNVAGNCTKCVDNSTSISYFLTGTQLIRSTAANVNQVLADGITAFTVMRSRRDWTPRAGGLGGSNAANSGMVTLNNLERATAGQAKDLIITMTSGPSNAKTAHITKYTSASKLALIYPPWTTATTAGNTYRLSTHVFTLTITKTDPSSGVSATLTQTVYPNSNISFPVN